MKNESQETASAKLAQTAKAAGVAAGAAGIVKAAVLSAILVLLGILSWAADFPWYIGAVLVTTAAAILLLQVLTLKRVAAVDLQKPNLLPPDHIPLEPGEELTAVIPGVMQYGKVRSYAVLGTDKVAIANKLRCLAPGSCLL